MEFIEKRLNEIADIDYPEDLTDTDPNKKLKEVLTLLSVITLYNVRTQCVKPIIRQKEAERCAKEGYLTLNPLKWFIEILTTESEWRVKNNVIDIAVVMDTLRWCCRNYVLTPSDKLIRKNSHSAKKQRI